MQERVVLLRSSNVEPNAVEAGRRSQFRFRDVGFVVPQHPAMEAGRMNMTIAMSKEDSKPTGDA